MARYGILADIHGNLAALRAAARFLVEEAAVEQIVCLGDIVGYNAEPDACVEALRELGAESVAGNHDLIAAGSLGFERCAVRPAHALRRTREVLSRESFRALVTLPAQMLLEEDVLLFHGGFRDVCQYMTTAGRVLENATLVRAEVPQARICFFGHTHERRVWHVRSGVATAEAGGPEVDVSGADRVYFVNPGSVDAARKEGDRRAQVAVFDSERRRVAFHDVAYDHAGAERRAALGGYRIGPLEERVRLALRALSRRRQGVFQRLNTWSEARGWASRGGSV